MPHSMSPESIPADDSSRTTSQVDTVKSEPNTQDISMADAPTPPKGEDDQAKVDLEDLFDDDDGDGDDDQEFASSAPQFKSEEEPSQPSQPAPMYLSSLFLFYIYTDSEQQNNLQVHLLGPRNHARLLPTPLPLPLPLPMAQPLHAAYQRLCVPRICLHTS